MNEKIDLTTYYGTSSRNVFVCFLGELKTPKRHFEINWPLESLFCEWWKDKGNQIEVFKRPMCEWVKSFLKKPSVFVNSWVSQHNSSWLIEFRWNLLKKHWCRCAENKNASWMKTTFIQWGLAINLIRTEKRRDLVEDFYS